MHFYALVAFPPTDDPIEEVVDRLMGRYNEQNCRCYDQDEDATCVCGAFFDWYQIGGRWTGELDTDYGPTADPRNTETCELCDGTGVRPGGLERFGQAWFDSCNGCNGCSGIGARVKWPTQWAEHSGDVARLGDVRAKLASSPPYRVLAGELVYAKERWDGEHYVPADDVGAELARLSDDCTVVVVDYHS